MCGLWSFVCLLFLIIELVQVLWRFPQFVDGCLLVAGGLLALVVRVLERLSEVLGILTMITNEWQLPKNFPKLYRCYNPLAAFLITLQIGKTPKTNKTFTTAINSLSKITENFLKAYNQQNCCMRAKLLHETSKFVITVVRAIQLVIGKVYKQQS